jgi:hypothetical protein
LKIGENGRAYIVDTEGIVVALSKSENQMTIDSEGNRIPRNIESLSKIDEGLKLAIDNEMISGEGAITISGKGLTVSKTPVTGISADWNIIIVSVDADYLVKSKSLYSTLSTLHYVIIGVLCLSISWEFYSFYMRIAEAKKRGLGVKDSSSMGAQVKESGYA